MPPHGAFPAEEFGSGSRPTPLFDAPAWMKAHGQPPAERITLTPLDQAFLESPPTYEQGESLMPPAEPVATLPAPSKARRVLSLVLFVAITGTALAVLVMAALRYLGR
jgi:hypothetical protein